MVSAQLPLFQGGGLKAQQRKAKLELEQLRTQVESTQLALSTRLRRAMNNLLTALFNLEFTQSAADASRKSLELVTSSYNEGAVSVVELLDSQNASVNASLGAVQARIAFLRAASEMQRITGDYEFMLSDEARASLRAFYLEQFALSQQER